MKILALTSIRSDYDLLSPLYELLHNDKSIDFKLLVSGAHLSEEFGYTVQYIKQDGYDILLQTETLINSDTLKSKLKTASILLLNSIDVISQYNPDVILYAGDREDVVIGGLLGTFLNIPTIHFHGGDHESTGHEDTVIRHTTSKLSTYHFVSNKEHYNRLLSIGESQNRIYNIGSISLDRFKSNKVYTKKKIIELLSLESFKKSSLVIYHPSFLDDDSIVFENVLKSLKNKNIFSFVAYPNTDSKKSKITNIIRKYKNDKNFYFYKNMDRDVFLSIFKISQFIIGNSSAGIYEAAAIPIPAINVGKRQQDRMVGENVVFCGTSIKEITVTIEKITSQIFLSSIKNIINPYGDGESANRAFKLIKEIDLKGLIQKVEDPL